MGVALNAGNGCTAADARRSMADYDRCFGNRSPVHLRRYDTQPHYRMHCHRRTATGRPDYMFLRSNNYQEILSYLLPAGAESGTSATLPNTTDAAGGTSDIIVDNESTPRAGVEPLLPYARDFDHHLRNNCRVLRG